MRNKLIGAAVAVFLMSAMAMAEEGPGGSAAGGGAPAATGSSASVAVPTSETGALVSDEASEPEQLPGQEHTVEQGDTLWELAQKYMGSPWYWPKIWSFNPQVANPHWIYPGNKIRFFGSGDEGPAQVDVGGAPIASSDDDEDGAESSDSSSSDKVKVTGQIGYVQRRTVQLRTQGFVTPGEVEGTGEIVGSFGEVSMLSFPYDVYAKFRRLGDVQAGDQFVVFRTTAQLNHPITGDSMGFLTTILGKVKVLKIHPKQRMASVELTAMYDEIRRGDYLGPLGENLIRSYQVRGNAKDLDGFVVAAVPPYLSTFGEHSLVIIDQGSDNGVQSGNTFSVIRQHDGTMPGVAVDPTIVDESMPEEDVGTCMTVEVKSRASTCLVTRSLREIVVGDRIQMRKEATSNPPRASR